MNKPRLAALLQGLALSLPAAAQAPAPEPQDLAPYPAPATGLERFVMRLPAMERAHDSLVEIQVGRRISSDCNRPRLFGKLERRIADGWGFPYFEITDISQPMTTLMACPDQEQPVERFITVHGDGFMQPYKSELPMVIHVPAGYRVRYRVWRAAEGYLEAERQ